MIQLRKGWILIEKYLSSIRVLNANCTFQPDWLLFMEFYYVKSIFQEQMCFTRVQRELNTIIIFVFQELKVRILRICRTRLLLYLAKKKKNPLQKANLSSVRIESRLLATKSWVGAMWRLPARTINAWLKSLKYNAGNFFSFPAGSRS